MIMSYLQYVTSSGWVGVELLATPPAAKPYLAAMIGGVIKYAKLQNYPTQLAVRVGGATKYVQTPINLQHTVVVGSNPVALVLCDNFLDGYIWVCNSGSNSATIFDLSGTITSTIPLNTGPSSICYEGNNAYVWIGCSGTSNLYRYYSNGGSLLHTLAMGVPINNLASSNDGYIWASNGSAKNVYKINVGTYSVTYINTGSYYADKLCYTGGFIYATSKDNYISIINTSKNSVTTKNLGLVITDLCADQYGNIWGIGTTAVYKINSSGSIIATISISGSYSITSDGGGGIWVSTYGIIYKIDPTKNAITNTYKSAGLTINKMCPSHLFGIWGINNLAATVINLAEG